MSIIFLSIFLFLFRACLLVTLWISAFMWIAMSIVILVTRKTLLVFCFLNQVINDVLIKLKLIKFVLFKINWDRLVISIVIVEKITRRCPRLVRLKACVHGHPMQSQIYRLEMRVYNQQRVIQLRIPSYNLTFLMRTWRNQTLSTYFTTYRLILKKLVINGWNMLLWWLQIFNFTTFLTFWALSLEYCTTWCIFTRR